MQMPIKTVEEIKRLVTKMEKIKAKTDNTTMAETGIMAEMDATMVGMEITMDEMDTKTVKEETETTERDTNEETMVGIMEGLEIMVTGNTHIIPETKVLNSLGMRSPSMHEIISDKLTLT